MNSLRALVGLVSCCSLVVVAASCSSKSEEKSTKSQGSGEKKSDTPGAVAASGGAAADLRGPTAAELSGPGAIANVAPAKLASVCEQMLPLDDATNVLEKGKVQLMKPPRPMGPRKVECSYHIPIEGFTDPAARVVFLIDCSSLRGRRDAMKRVFANNEGFEESDLGFYLKIKGQHQFQGFVDEPACSFVVTTRFQDDRKVDELAEIIGDNLSKRASAK